MVISINNHSFFFQKINVNEAIDGRVPLHYAADYGQKDVLTYLLDKGANPNVKINITYIFFRAECM